MPMTVGPLCLTHPVNFPCGRKPEYPEETHDLRQSVDFYSSHEDWVRVALRKFSLRLEPAASEVKGKCANHLATEAPKAPPKPHRSHLLLFKSFLWIVCESFIVKLTFVEVHDKKESKLFSLSVLYELNLFHFKVRVLNKLSSSSAKRSAKSS